MKEITILSSFLILFFTINLTLAQQNLCGNDLNTFYVADPSHCSSYLYCHRRDYWPHEMQAVYQLTCKGTGGEYFLEDGNGAGVCQEDNSHCSEPLSMCPHHTLPDIMIADPLDYECRRYRPCRYPGFPYRSCTAPLVFNRNTGSCDFDSNAPCDVVRPPPECPPGGTGNFPANTCYEYIFCYMGENLGTYKCSDGLMFDSRLGECVIDYQGICPRSMMELRIPQAKVKRSRSKGLEEFLYGSK